MKMRVTTFKTGGQRGFTIVELLIVVVVIAILAAITIVAFNGVTNRAKASAAQSAVEQAVKKVALYAVSNSDQYPNTLGDAGVANSGNAEYQYSVNNSATPATYCITATVTDVSYFASNAQTAPTKGGCPGHGQNGIASVTNLVTNPSFETGSGTVEVQRNLAVNPNAAAATGFNSNNGAVWLASKETASVTTNPQGIITRAKSVLNGAQSSPILLSMYNIDGLSNTGPVRTVGAWFYVTASGYEAYIGSSGARVALPSSTWTWVTGDIAASSYGSAYVLKAAGQGNAGQSDTAYITGVTAVVGSTPRATIAGGIDTLDGDMTASWTGTANASASILTGVTVPNVTTSGAVAIQSGRWSKYGTKSLRIIATGTPGSCYAILSVGANAANRGTFMMTLHRDAAQPDRSAYNGVAYWNPTPQPMSSKWLGAGDRDVRVYGDPGPAGTNVVVRLDGVSGDPDLYVDGFFRVEGNYQGAYHDGSDTNWIWNGASNASSSTGPGN